MARNNRRFQEPPQTKITSKFIPRRKIQRNFDCSSHTRPALFVVYTLNGCLTFPLTIVIDSAHDCEFTLNLKASIIFEVWNFFPERDKNVWKDEEIFTNGHKRVSLFLFHRGPSAIHRLISTDGQLVWSNQGGQVRKPRDVLECTQTSDAKSSRTTAKNSMFAVLTQRSKESRPTSWTSSWLEVAGWGFRRPCLF